MSLPVWPRENFSELIVQRIPVLDVRAPVEFQAGAIPGSCNEPILTNEERHEIGTIYKSEGSEAAIQRGYELVSGSIKEVRVQKWKEQVASNSSTVLTCFRGGQRSQITQKWLLEVGVDRPRIQGGYKAFRNFLIEELDRLSERPMIVISGATGSGKTLAIRDSLLFRPTVDLEDYANHRGSAFGGYPTGQPSQADFENRLAAELIRIDANRDMRPLVVEDESRLIGRCAQPEKFFDFLRRSPIVLIDEPLEVRVENTYQDYILNSPLGGADVHLGLQTFERYHQSLKAISRKLGGLMFSEIEKDLLESQRVYSTLGNLESNRIWIRKLLHHYYDPLYFGSLERRQPLMSYRGSRRDIIEWLKEC